MQPVKQLDCGKIWTDSMLQMAAVQSILKSVITIYILATLSAEE